ncbi:MAG: 1-acyl-sn-glycerol-3-phosphate acyltransferase [candidate division Zixibacteria bacterium]|nr:1-acyl-sn-glycerol-3-phosphate acyltransferase [candidate division Zixibacteria bacterium]
MRLKILYHTGATLTRLISKLVFRIRIRGKEHIPRKGGFILASNHISWYDPPIVGSWCGREVYFFAKRELFKNKFFGWLISRTNAFPVKRGAVDREALQMAHKVVADGFGLVFFPEGTRSMKEGFLDPKPGVGLLATDSECMIVPCYIHGSNRLKKVLLGRDRMSVRYGKAISAEWVKSIPKDKAGYQTIAAEIMNRIAALKEIDYPDRSARASH